MQSENKYIDTTIKVQKKDFGYILSGSYPLPKNWKMEMERDSTIIYRGFGYVPIEKSVRVFGLQPDTLFNGSWSHTDNL